MPSNRTAPRDFDPFAMTLLKRCDMQSLASNLLEYESSSIPSLAHQSRRRSARTGRQKGRANMSVTSPAERRIQRHISALDSPDLEVAARAETYLIRYYGTRALEPLLAACDHSNPNVRFE